jgi:hypothetical protein
LTRVAFQMLADLEPEKEVLLLGTCESSSLPPALRRIFTSTFELRKPDGLTIFLIGRERWCLI